MGTASVAVIFVLFDIVQPTLSLLRLLLGRPHCHEDIGGMLRKAVMVCETLGSGQPLTDADLSVLRLSFARVRDSAWQRSISFSLVLFIF